MNDTIIVFDEFHSYPGWRGHEHKAGRELQEASRHLFDLQCFALGGEVAVSVRVVRKASPGTAPA